MPFFSIIMPVYKVEKYLERAIKSVLEQTYSDFELLLIDDASPDRSLYICRDFAEKDGRVKVIHLDENKGVSNARNIGIDRACGQYLMFMDSDDYIEKELLQTVYTSIKKNRADIIFFGITEEHYDSKGNLKETVIFQLPQNLFKRQADLRRYMIELEKATLYGYACNKFYRLDYLKRIGLRYKEYALNEDILFNVEFCMNIKRMNVLSVPAYHYRKVNNGASRTSQFVDNYFELHKKRVQAILEQYQYWGNCSNYVKAELASIYTRYIMSALQRNCDKRSNMKYADRKRWIKALYDDKVFRAVMPYGHPQSRIVRILYNCLKYHRTYICLALGRVIYMVKTYSPGIFNRVQKNR